MNDLTITPIEFTKQEREALKAMREALEAEDQQLWTLMAESMDIREKTMLKLINWALANMNLGRLPMWGSGAMHHSPEDYD